MKLIILKENFKNGLSSVERAVIENANLPVLKNILLKTQNNKIKISATNLEIGIERFVTGKIIEEGGITAPFGVLYNIISNLDAERISIETEKNKLLLKTDNYQAKIQGTPEEDFPIIPKIKNQNQSVEINTSTLTEAIERVVGAAQISEIRPEISGVLFDFQITFLKFVATDSFRLAQTTIYDQKFKTSVVKGFKAIIPLKTIQELLRTIKKDQNIKIYFEANQVLFVTEEQEFISRLIDGQYPDYEQIIPEKTETEIITEKAQILSAVKLVSALSGRVNDIKIAAKNGSKTIEIYSTNQNIGENNYLIPSKIKGPEFQELTFNWRYLIDGIKMVDSNKVFIGVNGDSKPAVIKSPDDQSYFYILMPIKAG